MFTFLIKNKDITHFSGFKTKAFSEYFFEIKNLKDFNKLKEVIKFWKKEKLKLVFIWSGTNLLFAFDVFDWILVKNNLKWFEIKDSILEIYSWELISKISKDLFLKNKNDCFVSWVWLPGTIGWAVAWNAWSFWLEISDVFVSAKLFDLNQNQIIEVDKDFMNFDYRNSVLKKMDKYFLISVKLNIYSRQNKFNLKQVIELRSKQPHWFTCGSFFKNPIWNFAWKLIEESDLKWTKIWWAFISEKHANFIMSDWTASFQDVLDLKNLIQKTVLKNFWIKLQEEIKIIF